MPPMQILGLPTSLLWSAFGQPLRVPQPIIARHVPKHLQNNLNHSNSRRYFAASSKKRRKLRPLTSHNKQYPKTTRERIRWLQDHNQRLNDRHYQHKAIDRRIEDVAEVTEERLQWMRNKIYGFWHGNKEGPPKKSGRPQRIGIKMDSKWWFWNIAFALLPAFFIAVYCEFIGKPEMIEFHKQMHIREQKKILGDAYREDQDEELVRILQDSVPITTKLYNAVRDLAMYFSGQIEEAPPLSAPKSDTSKDQNKGQSKVDDENDIDAETVAGLKKRLEDLERRLQERQHGMQPATISTTGDSPTSRIRKRVDAQRQEDARRREEKRKSEEEQAKSTGSLWETVSSKLGSIQDLWQGASSEKENTSSDHMLSNEKAKDAMSGVTSDEKAKTSSSQTSVGNDPADQQKKQTDLNKALAGEQERISTSKRIAQWLGNLRKSPDEQAGGEKAEDSSQQKGY